MLSSLSLFLTAVELLSTGTIRHGHRSSAQYLMSLTMLGVCTLIEPASLAPLRLTLPCTSFSPRWLTIIAEVTLTMASYLWLPSLPSLLFLNRFSPTKIIGLTTEPFLYKVC